MARGRGVRKVEHPYRVSEAFSPGFRAISLYSLIVGISYLFSLAVGMYNPSILPVALTQQMIWVVQLVALVLLITMVYGLAKRKPWAYPLALAWFTISILLSLSSVFMVDPGTLPAMRYLLWGMAIAVVAIDLAVLWYLANRKQYLLRPHLPMRRLGNEQQFVRLLSCCWVVLLLISGVLGIHFYQHTVSIADRHVEELADTTVIHGIVLCDTKQGQERDICYVVLATMYPEQDRGAICGRISSAFYRFTCVGVR